MTNRAIRVLLMALLAATVAITAGSQQLNPTVTLLKTPTMAVPSDCDQSLAPQPAPRVEVAQIPAPPPRKVMAAPPTASVRVQLKDVQTAADRGDRDGFRGALARIKATLETYPPGGEKTAAGDVIRVYDDLDRIWTYQMESPTGSFFDATTVPAQIMRGYPGFERAIADEVFVDANGTKFYPTSETREFLLREAAARLKTLGVNVAARAPRPARVIPRIAATPVKPARPETKSTERKETKNERKVTAAKPEAIVTEHKAPARHRPARKTKRVEEQKAPAAAPAARPKSETIESSGAVSAPKTEAAHEAAPRQPAKPVVKTAGKASGEKPANASTVRPSATTSAAPSTPSTTSAAPAETTGTTATGMAPATPATQTAATVPATETTASASATETETTASAASTDTTGTAAKGQSQGKGVILPIILIVVGIGVLIVLFRASS